ncbi:hypothetical protein DYB28_008370 [Aphanomyces astaci]|uniref:Uncharacterized protein n=1 Tax=Aphanomyces astaci TaxID=112090 RepID=A0A9X8H3S0_APHAT|nr:hypothetical protein DYB28_008370 [Aphanomyces astaci]
MEADRFVMVMRQVEHDEVHVCLPPLKQRCFRSWTEVRQVSPSHILVRVVSHLSRLHQPATGFVSVDAFAAMTGIDVMDVNNKDAYVRREMIRRGHAEQDKYIMLTLDNSSDTVLQVWENAKKVRNAQATFTLLLFIYIDHIEE